MFNKKIKKELRYANGLLHKKHKKIMELNKQNIFLQTALLDEQERNEILFKKYNKIVNHKYFIMHEGME